jgi:eukaryotic-like serine/threonine-protein kinase
VYGPSRKMAADLEARAREVLRRLGSVPGDPSEARALMQRRVRVYLAIVLGIWTGMFVIDRILTLGFTGHLLYGPTTSTLAHAAIIGVLAGLYVFTRNGERAVVALGHAELVATTGQALAFSAMSYQDAPSLRPDLAMLLGVTHVLVLRAAIVPGTPWRAVGVGVLATAPVIAVSAYLYLGLPADPDKPPPLLLTIGIVIWSLVALVSTAAIAGIIYGLQERVRAAMKLGQYTLLEKIGEGGMGAVYRARHALLRRPTAVKVLASEKAGPAMIVRFEREVQLTSEIAHPNIVSVYDFGRSPDGDFYYAMEFLEGVDLQRLVELDGPQPAARVAHILGRVAEGLAEAHSVDLIHRDVKPANIVLCRHARRPDQVKVVDFGLVKQINSADPAVSSENAITGTPLYMAPEALTSPGEIDTRSDLYSLGAVGYFLLTGEPVFVGKTVLEVCAQTLHEPVVPPSKRAHLTLPPKLEALVMACLAKSKSGRPDSAEAFLATLRACDVTAWPLEEAQRWWTTRGEALERRPAKATTETTRTLAVAPRSPREGE